MSRFKTSVSPSKKCYVLKSFVGLFHREYQIVLPFPLKLEKFTMSFTESKCHEQVWLAIQCQWCEAKEIICGLER